MIFRTLCLLCLLLPKCFAGVETHFNTIKENPKALYEFLKELPKGGELHYHLTGGAYPEVLLALTEKADFCLNPKDFVLSPLDKNCVYLETRRLNEHPELYEKVLRAWSMKDFIAGSETGHDHFFNAFYKFGSVVDVYLVPLLMDVMQRAVAQNELYLEIMVLPLAPQNYASSATTPIDAAHFVGLQKKLLSNPLFIKNLLQSITLLEGLVPESLQRFGCEKEPNKPVCKLKVRFQYYLLRESPLESFFTQAVLAFEAASRSKAIVAVNSVQAEDGLIALRDYPKQMEILDYLHKVYPSVHITLHAGELARGSVLPADLRFHISEAIYKGHAERIGHGVSIAYENNASALLKYLHEKQIPIEINLTSNQKILNISGKNHPLSLYLANKVPVVLSTDDEGILRTDLTTEYVKAVIEHHLDYPTLKQISRAALTFSFLPGQSLWVNEAVRVKACKDLLSQNCLDFVNKNEKAALQRELEIKLVGFEKKYA